MFPEILRQGPGTLALKQLKSGGVLWQYLYRESDRDSTFNFS